MVKIRLRRTGAKKKPNYRVVVADARAPRDGRFIEIIGHYNPRTDPASFKIHEDRALHWLSVGAQPTDVVKKLLTHSGTYTKFDRVKAGETIADVVAQSEETVETEPQPPVAVEKAVSSTIEEEPVDPATEEVVEEAEEATQK